MFLTFILQSWILLSSLSVLALTGSCDIHLLYKHEAFFAIHVMSYSCKDKLLQGKKPHHLAVRVFAVQLSNRYL